MNTLVFELKVDSSHRVQLPDDLPVGTRVRITIEPLRNDENRPEDPHTELEQLALAARQAYLKRGGKLLSAEEISEEVGRRRGGVLDD
ncbi:MAG: hypothetical protein N838_22450 [Thiohalocapsa sp. PB-PSB1]|jgi:hypothetical protein|nr:hypothetical protein [Desulfofustis sp. PB-SRB1]QQO55697.1 MAG: hypothetical protein N838_22450 [Thiohalocapsa sp. PB-PSB1]